MNNMNKNLFIIYCYCLCFCYVHFKTDNKIKNTGTSDLKNQKFIQTTATLKCNSTHQFTKQEILLGKQQTGKLIPVIGEFVSHLFRSEIIDWFLNVWPRADLALASTNASFSNTLIINYRAIHLAHVQLVIEWNRRLFWNLISFACITSTCIVHETEVLFNRCKYV